MQRHYAIRDPFQTSSKSIRELAGNPLLLTMMAILNRNQELPRDRPELYNQASRVLLHQWDVERALIEDARIDPKTIDYRDKQAMLRKVAYRMQSSEKGLAGNLISATDLEAILTDYLKTIEVDQARTVARLFINQLRTRNFILCYLGADSYGFVHRTFLEYFCAWEFVWQFKEDQTLTIEQLINDVFGKHWQDESWHEVLRLICGMIEPKFVAKIIDFLLELKIDRSDFVSEYGWFKKEGLGNIILAVNCFYEVEHRKQISTTADQLLRILKSEIEQESEWWFEFDLVNTLISLIVTIWAEHIDTLPWLKDCPKSDSSSFVPTSVVNAIAQKWKEDPDTLPWLKERALHDENRWIQQAAIGEIAQGWKEDPDTLPWLKDRALKEEDSNVRQVAVVMIAQGWKEDPDTFPFLKDCALQDENEDVREAAVNAIVEWWKKDPDTLPFLKDRALQDENEDVREAAVNAIAEGWKQDPDTLPFLKDRALHDENWDVREATVNAIIQNGQEDPKLFEFLANIALNDPFKREHNFQDNPRQTALEGLLENFSDNTKTLEILNQVAVNDTDKKLREFAVEKLKESETGQLEDRKN